MNKSQLIDQLASRFEGNRKQAAHALDSVIDTITREIARGEKVAITGFGSFERAVRKAGKARNPQTGATIRTKKKNVPKFRPGQDLKNVVSGAKKLPKLVVAAPASAAGAAKKAASPAKKSSAAKKSTSGAKKTAANKSTAAKKSTSGAKKTAANKSTAAKKSTSGAKKTAANKSTPAKKSTSGAKKTAAKKTTAAKKAPAKKSTAKKTAKKS